MTIYDVTNDLSPGQLQDLLDWLGANGYPPTKLNIQVWRRINYMPDIPLPKT